MLRPRIIPCLLIKNGGLVKTVQFDSAKSVGDPINAVRIFNEKEVDELIVLDIDATVRGREPDYRTIAALAEECRMPLCYGGGVRTVEQIKRIVSLGVEKVSVSSAAIDAPQLVSDAAHVIGSQSVVVVMDVGRSSAKGGYSVFRHNGLKETRYEPIEFAAKVEKLGAGEVVINSIERDGTMRGYDIDLIRAVREATSLPLTVLGGAGSLDDIAALLKALGVVGAAAGSLFVFKGVYRAVLINYPDLGQKEKLIANARQETVLASEG